MKVTAGFMLAFVACTTLASTSVSAAPAKPAAKKAAPRAAAPKSGGGGVSNAAYNSYADQMRTKMGSKWDYPSGNNSVTLTVHVDQSGGVSELNLNSSPKNTEAEQKANDAFNSAQPLQPLPAGLSAAVITCQFNSQADQWNSKANISVKIDPQKTAEPPAAASTEEKKD